METDHTLEIMNTYKGVPFISRAKVLNIEGDVVSLITLDPAIVCLRNDKFTRVLGSDYFEPSAARVVSVDIPLGVFKLSSFTYSGAKLGERMIVRVQPAGVIEVNVESENQGIIGHLVDLSLSGLGLRIRQDEYGLWLKPGTLIQLSMELPNGQVTGSGTILSVEKMNAEHYRLSIRFAQNVQHRSTIFRYLIDRRAEIEQELRHEYEEAVYKREKNNKA